MTTDELARTFIDDLDQLPDVIPGAVNLEPGRIAWLHGAKAGGAKTPGVFYAKDTAFTDPPGALWATDDRHADQGETGYSAPELHIAIIGWRDQWFVPGKNKGDMPTWLTTYEKGAKKLTEYLIRVDGIATPMVLSVSGLYKARPIADLISDYKRGALTQAMRQSKKSLPLWSFWLPIANKRDTSGKTVYIEAQDASGKTFGSLVTPPALAGQPVARSVTEILDDARIWADHQDWLRYKRTPQGVAEAEYVIEAPRQLPPGRNVPQPVEADEDLPF